MASSEAGARAPARASWLRSAKSSARRDLRGLASRAAAVARLRGQPARVATDRAEPRRKGAWLRLRANHFSLMGEHALACEAARECLRRAPTRCLSAERSKRVRCALATSVPAALGRIATREGTDQAHDLDHAVMTRHAGQTVVVSDVWQRAADLVLAAAALPERRAATSVRGRCDTSLGRRCALVSIEFGIRVGYRSHAPCKQQCGGGRELPVQTGGAVFDSLAHVTAGSGGSRCSTRFLRPTVVKWVRSAKQLTLTAEGSAADSGRRDQWRFGLGCATRIRGNRARVLGAAPSWGMASREPAMPTTCRQTLSCLPQRALL
jgi:hypothetical protein